MTAERQPPSKLFRFVISILVIGHLAAVVLPPMSFQARGPLGVSPSISALLYPVEGYGQFLYIDRGYAFFAPDPGPSHLIQAAITDSSGDRVEQMYPDRQKQWPRLLYHRHFMLAEFLEEIYQPPGPPPELVELDREAADYWVRTRARYEHVRQSVVEHLKVEHPGHEVAIRRIEHLIPDVLEFQDEPVALSDPRFYQVILDQPIIVESDGDLAAPAGPPESIPSPQGAAVERDTDQQAAEVESQQSPADASPTAPAETKEDETEDAETDAETKDAETKDAELENDEDNADPDVVTADLDQEADALVDDSIDQGGAS